MSFKNPLLKIVLLGDGGVGKSCLMNRYLSNNFNESSFHTIGVEFLSKEIEVNDSTYTLQIWDTAGQERFRSLRTPFYRGSDMCLLVCCVDDRNSFENLALWKREFSHYADVKDTEFPFVVLANKVDISSEKWEVTDEELAAWCIENGALPHLKTSAKNALNVNEAFSLAVEAWATLDASRNSFYEAETVKLGNTPGDQSSKLCC